MSRLDQHLQEYLALRRALGFRLQLSGGLLQKFVTFAQQQGATFISRELALQWAKQSAKSQPAQWANRLGMVRRFAQYCSAVDPRTEIPPPGLLPHRFQRKPPHFYSDDEIARLLKAAARLDSPGGLRADTYVTLFGLLVVTGMRISEPLALKREDVDLVQGILTVRQTKFGKTRLIPIHSTTREALAQYARLRDCCCPHPQDPNFFLDEHGRRLKYGNVRWTFLQLSRRIGLREPADRFGPRIHDLRHHFAIGVLLAWYRSGSEVTPLLPVLSTFLGHSNITDTYWYLSATPELLELATRRLERKQGGGAS